MWAGLILSGGRRGSEGGCNVIAITFHEFGVLDSLGQAPRAPSVRDRRATHCRLAPPQGPWACASGDRE